MALAREGAMNRLGNAIHTAYERLQVWVRGRSTLAAGSRIELSTESKVPIAIQFCHDVNRASRLLDFLIEEGHPYHVSDEIIEKIEAACGRVGQSDTPTPEQRAELLKAYRDLVGIPGTAVLFDFPPTPFWHSWWRAAFVLTAIIVPLIASPFLLLYQWWQYWYLPLGFSVVAALLTWGLYVFTGIVTNRKLNHIISFCYLFTLVVLAGSLAPWWIPGLFAGPASQSPVGLLRACAVPAATTTTPAATEAKSSVPCKSNDGYQWVLNIGGVVEGPIAREKPAAQAESATQTPEQKYQETPLIYSIRGGLVVPLYVIILSLMGGAVSMTRRVPEYQRRAMSAQDPLTNQQARENLVFQIMQVASAPLIAVVAYYVVNPTTTLESVVLGFGSGFASEPILLMIRGLVDKLSPEGPALAAPLTVRVDPPTKILEPGKSHQFTARVSGAPTSEVTWLIVPSDAGSISQSGYYTAPNDVGKTVTITACSVADRTKCGNASVTTKKAGSDDQA
jgi:hypothetical protein